MAGKFQRYRLDGRGQLQLVRGEGGLAALQQHLPGSPAATIHLNSLEALWLREALEEMLGYAPAEQESA